MTACNHFSSKEVTRLQCEGLTNPLGIDNTTPHFSWKLNSTDKQTAYQIRVASHKELLDKGIGDFWDSEKVESSESTWITYYGKALKSKDFAYWQVRVWNQDGQVSDWSDIATFGVGLLSEKDWQAQYIGLPTHENKPQSPLFWKSFTWDGDGEKVLLHINSLGYHEAYINGNPVSQAVLTPAVSQFEKRSLICTYDVTSLLKKGENDLVLWLGKGGQTHTPCFDMVHRHRGSHFGCVDSRGQLMDATPCGNGV
jgi:alpha-L-rhamnosidase